MILGINTASEKVSIALYGQKPETKKRKQESKFSQEIVWKSYRTQSKELLPKIDKFLKSCQIRLKDLKAIAVFQGPGSYTGLRVGISIANAMAWALDIPVIGIKMKNQKSKNKNLDQKNKYSPIGALKIAQKAEEILKVKKHKKFFEIVIPYYGSSLK